MLQFLALFLAYLLLNDRLGIYVSFVARETTAQ